MKISSILLLVATATAAPLALPVPEPQRGINFGNIAGQLGNIAGQFGHIGNQIAGQFGNLAGQFSNIGNQIAGNLGNLTGNLIGNIPRFGDILGNLPSPGDFCLIPIVCDFIKVVQTDENGSAEEKEAAIKVFLADWEKATPAAKQLFAAPAPAPAQE
jgi:hypothetical protein